MTDKKEGVRRYTAFMTASGFVGFNYWGKEKAPSKTAEEETNADTTSKIKAITVQKEMIMPANSVNIILVRHGQSELNLKNVCTGHLDPDLTDKGMREACKAGYLIRNSGMDLSGVVVFTSALQRAKKTANAIAEAIGVDPESIISDARLNERHYGIWQGMNKDEVKKKYAELYAKVHRGYYDAAPEGESLEMVHKKLDSIWAEKITPLLKGEVLVNGQKAKAIIFATHGNTNRAETVRSGMEIPESVCNREFETGVPLVVEMKNGRFYREYKLETSVGGLHVSYVEPTTPGMP